MAMTTQAWYDKAFVSVCALGGNEVQLSTKTNSLKISGGGFDIESIDTFGGKITRPGTYDDIEITFEGIPTSHQDFDWMLAGHTTNTQSALTGNAITSSTLTKYRVTLLWTDTAATSAAQSITGGSQAYRRSFADAYLTSLDTNMDAGDNLKATMTFKLAEEDSDGKNNWGIWSKDTTSGTMSALNAFTSSTTKW